ncbi:MAG: aerotolerance regulator BatA [Flavobacteriales bacterium]|nr:aerotolerance regulator BatA [Flavobacteriales bacterium]MBH70861.1 aerotolerance regulator BatA [Flavobacteriales bacterium]
MNNFSFVNSELLILLIIPIIILIWNHIKKSKIKSSIEFSNTESLQSLTSVKTKLKNIPYYLKLVAFSLLVIAIARPQSSTKWEESTTEGIDIIISMDISGSMLAEDLKPNRLESSKNVAMSFISKRINDRIGLTIFSGESFTQCPLTTDHNVLINLFKDVKSGMIEDGTAIGMGLANAVNRLKESNAISKVVILLTDGVNNSGTIAPLTAAEIAKKFGIRVYTIGIGSEGYAPYPFQTPFGIQYQDVEVKIDEKTLQDIATITDGKYFRAKNNSTLKKIYEDIDLLEKSKIETIEFNNKSEEFLPFGIASLCFLIVAFLLNITYLKRIP